MKIFVIHDETGKIYAMEYNERISLPEKLDYIQAEIPDNAIVTGVNMVTKEVEYQLPPENALEKEVKELRAQVAYLTMMSGIEMEDTNE